jgi:hypothetical protein
MTKQPSPPRAPKLLTIDLGTDLKTSWYQWCARHDLVPGKAARHLIETKLKEAPESGQTPRDITPRVRVGSTGDNGPKIGHEVYFTPSEHQALLAVAAAQGFGLHEFVIAAVRAALAQAPTYGQAELETLTRSNASLATILGALMALRQQTPDAELAHRLAALEQVVRTHIEQVSRSMAVGARRWQFKV